MHLQSFISGLATGVLLGLLFAPDKGDNTRRKVSAKASTIKDNITHAYEDFVGDVSNEIQNVRDEVDEILSKVPKR